MNIRQPVGKLNLLLFMSLSLFSFKTRATETLTVLTSYPDEVVSRFEEAFEQVHPAINVQIVWRRSHDALTYLQQKEHGVDVYWTPAPENFLSLKAQRAFAPLNLDTSGLPDTLKQGLLADPDGFYRAHETAGYGFFINPDALQKLDLPVPRRWEDLTNPKFKQAIALPVPSKVGYAPMLIDQLLQHTGWQRGWDTWRAIAANSRLALQRGNFITEEVTSGRTAVGVTMDFFAASTIASGSSGQFIYPEQTAFNPAHIAIFASSQHPSAANTFVTFILSPQGQALLFHPAIRKLPVRPALYSQAPAGYANPFELNINANYDPIKGLGRFGFNNALFDAAITRPFESLVAAHEALQIASQAVTPKTQVLFEQAKAELNALPITEPSNNQALVIACEQRQTNKYYDEQCTAAEQGWDKFFTQHYMQAQQLAERIIALAPHGKAP